MADTPPVIDRLARWTRFALLAAIAVVLGLIVTTPRHEYPLSMSRAEADDIASAPRFLMTTISQNANERFFLVDTDKKVICSYSVTGDQFLLASARKFDVDREIPDGSQPMNGVRIQGNPNGATRDEAVKFFDGWKEFIKKWATPR